MIKKSMDIMDVYAVSQKYVERLSNCFVDNIYSTGQYWLFKLKCRDGKHYLKLEPSVRVHVSRVEPIEKGIDKFTAFMRKHIRGMKISMFKQLGWERIVEIDLEGHGREYRLIVEILPRGFLLLLDSEWNILYANRYATLRDRVIKRGVRYSPPPGYRDLEEYLNSLHARIRVGKDLVRGIVKGWGLPGYIAEEILYRSGMYSMKNVKVENVDRTDLDQLIEEFMGIMREARDFHGYVVKYEGGPKLYTAYKPYIYVELYDAELIEHDMLDDAIDSYFTVLEKERMISRKREEIESRIKSLEKTIESQLEMIEGFEEKYKKYMRFYDLIVRNYNIVEKALDCARNTREEDGWEYIVEVCRNIVRVEKDKGLIYVLLDNVEVPLDIRFDVWRNASKYMVLANEYRGKAKKAFEHLEELKKKIEELRSISISIKDRVVRGIRPKYWYERFHWLITSNGFLVIGGRDADQNEALVKKYMEPRDIFLHAEIHGAPATIMKTGGKNPSERDLYEAAVIAACYSRGWRERLGYLEVFWVYGEQVSKKPPSGEYLEKGAFMIYGKKNYVRVELRLALGVEETLSLIHI